LDAGATVASLKGTYPGGEEAVLATRVIEAIHQSAASGETVSIL